MFDPDSIMDFAGYRYTVVEEKIARCLAAARRGETSVTIDADDLTEEEIRYLKEEVERRLGDGT